MRSNKDLAAALDAFAKEAAKAPMELVAMADAMRLAGKRLRSIGRKSDRLKVFKLTVTPESDPTPENPLSYGLEGAILAESKAWLLNELTKGMKSSMQQDFNTRIKVEEIEGPFENGYVLLMRTGIANDE